MEDILILHEEKHWGLVAEAEDEDADDVDDHRHAAAVSPRQDGSEEIPGGNTETPQNVGAVQEGSPEPGLRHLYNVHVASGHGETVEEACDRAANEPSAKLSKSQRMPSPGAFTFKKQFHTMLNKR